jgi:hypothetical protein
MLFTFTMMRVASVALALVVIFSIAYVLITPDPSDDVDGFLRPNQLGKALVSVSLLQSQLLVIVPFPLSMPQSSPQRLTATALLDLVCVCRW